MDDLLVQLILFISKDSSDKFKLYFPLFIKYNSTQFNFILFVILFAKQKLLSFMFSDLNK